LPQFAVLPGLQKRIKWALPVLAWLVCLATARPALAQGVPGTLVEIDLGRFIILGPVEVEAELYAFAQARGPALNAAYDVLAPLYGATPVIPINIRVYADRVEFAKLNAIVPPLADNAIHTHLGSREIALILPFPSGYLASGEAVNAIRHELSGLLLSTLSANRMPAGLELGFNQYVEAPGPQTERAVARLQAALDSATFGPLFSWRSLFEGTQVYSNTGVAYSQSLSIAACAFWPRRSARARATAAPWPPLMANRSTGWNRNGSLICLTTSPNAGSTTCSTTSTCVPTRPASKPAPMPRWALPWMP
jgi:hypothetical protein